MLVDAKKGAWTPEEDEALKRLVTVSDFYICMSRPVWKQRNVEVLSKLFFPCHALMR